MLPEAVTLGAETRNLGFGTLHAKLGRAGPESVAPTRARLIEKGLIYSPSYGLNEFTVPHFDVFIRRSFPAEAE
jgi:hypothetical protein